MLSKVYDRLVNNLCEPEDMYSQVKANSVNPADRSYCQALLRTTGMKKYSRDASLHCPQEAQESETAT